VSRRSAQRGAALLAMLAVIVLGGSWWLVSGLRAASNRTALERSQNAAVLRLARQALIGYAATLAGTDDINPGRLPCPEAAGYIGDPLQEGKAGSFCTAAGGTIVGRLPWKTLGIDQLRDAAGEPLWYIVSPGWALPNSVTPTLGINSNSAGNLAVDGEANAAVALIIAPGAPMVVAPNANQIAAGCTARTQVRTPSAPNYLDYLECQNVAGSRLRSAVVDNSSNTVFNDQVAVVAAANVLAAVEPMVAMRIQRDVVSQLQSVYASSDWGTSAANPAFPFAATYADPASSSFKGVAGTTQGLMPLTSSTCNTMTNTPCDTTFVAWNAVATTVSKSGGTATLSSFTCSGTSTLSCTVVYGCPALCFLPSLSVNVVAYASNVGMAFRTYDNSYGVGGLSAVAKIQPYSPLQSNGSAKLNFSGSLPVGPLFCAALNCASNTFSVPLTMFPDHPFLDAAGPTPSSTGTVPVAWFWFLVNNWYQVTYYAVAPLHTPGGAGNCSGATCISVTVQGGTALSGKRAVLTLAGRSLVGTSGSNRALSDFLDSTENTNLDLVFEQSKSNRSFNDRFVSISP
jgi:hypothetical protein